MPSALSARIGYRVPLATRCAEDKGASACPQGGDLIIN